MKIKEQGNILDLKYSHCWQQEYILRTQTANSGKLMKITGQIPFEHWAASQFYLWNICTSSYVFPAQLLMLQ